MSCRRRALLAWAGGAAGLMAGGLPPAYAGGQVEEPLADAVRTALAAAVAGDGAPPRLDFPSIEARLTHLRWLGAMSQRLARRKPDFNVRKEFLETVWYESRRAGLDTALVLGLIEVESGFRKYAISSVGARSYMQVMPFWGAPDDKARVPAAGPATVQEAVPPKAPEGSRPASAPPPAQASAGRAHRKRTPGPRPQAPQPQAGGAARCRFRGNRQHRTARTGRGTRLLLRVAGSIERTIP